MSHVSLGSRVAGLSGEVRFVDGRRGGLGQASSSRVLFQLRHVLEQAATAAQAYGGGSTRFWGLAVKFLPQFKLNLVR